MAAVNLVVVGRQYNVFGLEFCVAVSYYTSPLLTMKSRSQSGSRRKSIAYSFSRSENQSCGNRIAGPFDFIPTAAVIVEK